MAFLSEVSYRDERNDRNGNNYSLEYYFPESFLSALFEDSEALSKEFITRYLSDEELEQLLIAGDLVWDFRPVA